MEIFQVNSDIVYFFLILFIIFVSIPYFLSKDFKNVLNNNPDIQNFERMLNSIIRIKKNCKEEIQDISAKKCPSCNKLSQANNKGWSFVLILTGLIIMMMIIFPPFEFRTKDATFNLGYGFILSPPSFKNKFTGSVNTSLLAIQIMSVSIIGGIAYYVLDNKS